MTIAAPSLLGNKSKILISSRRCFSLSASHLKALKNWSRPSIAELGVPTESWQHVYNKNQKRFNLHLIAGAGAIAVSLLAFYANVDLNGTPKFLKKIDYVTKTPQTLASVESQSVTSPSPSEIVVVAEEAVKVAEEVVETVKDTLDVVEDIIESADEVVKEVKKLEDETLAIIEESKDIVKNGSELIKDVKDVIEEGVEIVSDVKDEIEKIIEDVKDLKEEVASSSETEEVKVVENDFSNDKIDENIVAVQEIIGEELSIKGNEISSEAVTETEDADPKILQPDEAAEEKKVDAENETLNGDIVASQTDNEAMEVIIGDTKQELEAVQISTEERQSEKVEKEQIDKPNVENSNENSSLPTNISKDNNENIMDESRNEETENSAGKDQIGKVENNESKESQE